MRHPALKATAAKKEVACACRDYSRTRTDANHMPLTEALPPIDDLQSIMLFSRCFAELGFELAGQTGVIFEIVRTTFWAVTGRHTFFARMLSWRQLSTDVSNMC